MRLEEAKHTWVTMALAAGAAAAMTACSGPPKASSGASSGGGGAAAGSSSASTGANSSATAGGAAGGSSSSTTGSTSASGSANSSGSGAMCSGAETSCAGACVDLTVNTKNCGACGHDCQGAACAGGLCAATDLATGLTQPSFVAVDATTVFYTTYYDVHRVPLAGGASQKLTNPMNPNMPIAPKSLAIDNQRVFWTTFETPSTGDVLSVSKSGSGLAVLSFTGWARPFGIAPSSSNGVADQIYWVDSGDGMQTKCAIARTPANGMAPAALGFASAKFLRAIAIDATNAYFTAADTGEVLMMPLTGGSPTKLAGGLDDPGYIAVDAASAYVISGGTSANAYQDGRVVKIPLAGGPPVDLATSAHTPFGIAIDASHVYFTARGSQAAQYADGAVMKVPIAGGPTVVIADQQASPMGLAVDDTYVYWANQGTAGNDGAIRKAPK